MAAMIFSRMQMVLIDFGRGDRVLKPIKKSQIAVVLTRGAHIRGARVARTIRLQLPQHFHDNAFHILLAHFHIAISVVHPFLR